ncbi:MAG: hypothetical protein GXY67_07885 [Clostridiales bacterium]|nr:hypothetical protein [Clostridiales bacterium]
MADKELHYLTYDPDEIWREMIAAYVDAGGDVLYPGDEKEILLRGVQAVLTQTFAAVDNALRMQTLRYAQGEYLDIYGENRNCPRIQANAAAGKVRITFVPTGATKTFPAGTAMTPDGERFYLLVNPVTHTGHAQVLDTDILCKDPGSQGNGVAAGTQMQLAITHPAVVSVVVIAETTGGSEREDDDTYRERIRLNGLAAITTGPSRQYEAAAKAATSEIVDARALNLGAGQVGMYLILRNTEGAAATIAAVAQALSASDVRPLTDTVTVQEAEAIPYALHILYAVEEDAEGDITAALQAAVSEYKDWQDLSVGRPFNPDRLTANLYRAGVSRVIYGPESHFAGGSVEYTRIDPDKRCLGTITLAVMEP